ncbi:MAG: nucleotidyl transferase AbiEii/AbiGii toxin family protein [Patescibacteria group bacterium]
MILPKPTDAIHKAWLYRILQAVADDAFLTANLRFKGGTCAAMRGLIDRFSIDLDFDFLAPEQMPKARQNLEKIFQKLGLKISQQSKKAPQYFLKYENRPGERSTIEFDASFPAPQRNEYEPVRFAEIDRILHCHTVPTMFANKLVAVMDRFKKHRSIAGRDIYDIHAFFLRGDPYLVAVIEERTGKKVRPFLKSLITFIQKHITQTILDQDLNVLLPAETFGKIRKILKQEVLMFLQDEIRRLE